MMGMHFKLGLYEHQSAGAIQGLIDLLADEPELLDDPDKLRARADHDLRAGLQHHRRPGQARPAHAAERRPLDGLHHRHAAAQGLRARRDGWDGRDGWRRADAHCRPIIDDDRRCSIRSRVD